MHEPSLPLVALNFAFVGGAANDPTDKPGVGYMVSSLLDEGAGELDANAFHQQLEDNAVELRFSVTQDYFFGSIRLLKDRQEQSFELLRLALNEPRFDADAIGRVREQILAGLRRETTDPGQHRQQDLVEHRVPRPSLRPPDRRLARPRSPPSPPTICAATRKQV